MKLLEGNNALVTGGGRGIGREVALDLARCGANVAVVARTKTELDQTVDNIEKFGGKGLAIPADLSTLDGISYCAKTFFDNFETIDILINNAGMTHVASVVEYPIELAQKLFNLNIMGYYAMIKEVLPKMIEQKRGNIVMTASVHGNIYFPPKKVAYATSKAAIAAMGKTLSIELKPYNITVNVVTPAGIETKMAEDLRKWGQQMPITIPPEFIAPAYIFLASDLAKKKYNGRVVELHAICEFLPVLQDEFGGMELDHKELVKLANEKIKKDQFKVLKNNSELVNFMLQYKR
ncbi:MAG: SDR family oxidoreductase [Promethearchaeota archaeon]|nr:MAG: SDR family oxidoreductase [Candidatus Lokiarchaeota archaeon]